MATKIHLNLVFIGHVDHGKSTTIGRLFYEMGLVSEQKLKKLKDAATKAGKETFEFAFVMDRLKEERDRGLTIDLMHERFETDKYYFTIIDAPGHRDFIKNMITGTSQADAAVLVVSAKDGVQAQTREHAVLARTMNVNQLIVAINKMDVVSYDKEVFERVKNSVAELLKIAGYKPESVIYVPISAFKGDNLIKKSDNLRWWKGPTFLESLDKLSTPEKPIDLPLRLPVQDVFSIKGIGTVPVGRVETGVLKPGDTIIFQPANVTGEVKSIEMHHEPLERAEPGDNIGFNVRGVDKKSIRRGDVVGHPSSPPTVVKEFTGQIVVLDHPTVISKGYTPVFHTHTSQVPCKIVEIEKKLDPKTGAELEKNPDFIKKQDLAIVRIQPVKPMVIERSKDIPQMGRFAIRDMGRTVAAGVVLDVKK